MPSGSFPRHAPRQRRSSGAGCTGSIRSLDGVRSALNRPLPGPPDCPVSATFGPWGDSRRSRVERCLPARFGLRLGRVASAWVTGTFFGIRRTSRCLDPRPGPDAAPGRAASGSRVRPCAGHPHDQNRCSHRAGKRGARQLWPRGGPLRAVASRPAGAGPVAGPMGGVPRSRAARGRDEVSRSGRATAGAIAGARFRRTASAAKPLAATPETVRRTNEAARDVASALRRLPEQAGRRTRARPWSGRARSSTALTAVCSRSRARPGSRRCG